VIVGVAIAIPQPHAATLTEWRHRFGDPAADKVWPHVTLLPPTPIAVDELPAIESHLAEVAREGEPFYMHLAGTGTFRPTSPVVFIPIARGVSDCEVLEKSTRSGPLDRRLEFPYHPHVTIAQDLADNVLDDAYEKLSGYAARFHVARFGLFSRGNDGAWTWRREFTLGSA
jgi:2'-5' RNA ligase